MKIFKQNDNELGVPVLAGWLIDKSVIIILSHPAKVINVSEYKPAKK